MADERVLPLTEAECDKVCDLMMCTTMHPGVAVKSVVRGRAVKGTLADLFAQLRAACIQRCQVCGIWHADDMADATCRKCAAATEVTNG